ncbi:MAG: hypothetical protein KC561_16480 [Myxococcales bacterium]|nr:hypothetical protein [Myxococcales bacterium]
MDKSKLTYDKKKRRLTYRAFLNGKQLLPKDTGSELGRIAREGEFNGQPVEAVAVRFDDVAAARYNADALKFLNLESESGEGKVVQSTAKFRTVKDFGIG